MEIEWCCKCCLESEMASFSTEVSIMKVLIRELPLFNYKPQLSMYCEICWCTIELPAALFCLFKHYIPIGIGSIEFREVRFY